MAVSRFSEVAYSVQIPSLMDPNPNDMRLMFNLKDQEWAYFRVLYELDCVFKKGYQGHVSVTSNSD